MGFFGRGRRAGCRHGLKRPGQRTRPGPGASNPPPRHRPRQDRPLARVRAGRPLCKAHHLAASADRAFRNRRPPPRSAYPCAHHPARRNRHRSFLRRPRRPARQMARRRHPRMPLASGRGGRAPARGARRRRPPPRLRPRDLAAPPGASDAAGATLPRHQHPRRPSLSPVGLSYVLERAGRADSPSPCPHPSTSPHAHRHLQSPTRALIWHSASRWDMSRETIAHEDQPTR